LAWEMEDRATCSMSHFPPSCLLQAVSALPSLPSCPLPVSFYANVAFPFVPSYHTHIYHLYSAVFFHAPVKLLRNFWLALPAAMELFSSWRSRLHLAGVAAVARTCASRRSVCQTSSLPAPAAACHCASLPPPFLRRATCAFTRTCRTFRTFCARCRVFFCQRLRRASAL